METKNSYSDYVMRILATKMGMTKRRFHVGVSSVIAVSLFVFPSIGAQGEEKIQEQPWEALNYLSQVIREIPNGHYEYPYYEYGATGYVTFYESGKPATDQIKFVDRNVEGWHWIYPDGTMNLMRFWGHWDLALPIYTIQIHVVCCAGEEELWTVLLEQKYSNEYAYLNVPQHGVYLYTVSPVTEIQQTWNIQYVSDKPPPLWDDKGGGGCRYCNPEIIGCPQIALWNGHDYLIENNLLPQSESQGGTIDVIDYYKVEGGLVPQSGNYSFWITEFTSDTIYLDQVLLMTVDHSPSVNVVISSKGELLTYQSPYPPLHAVSRANTDITSNVSYFDGDTNNSATFYHATMGDSITLGFENVPGRVTNAKLIIRIMIALGISDKEPILIEVIQGGRWQPAGIIYPRWRWHMDGANLTSDFFGRTENILSIRLLFQSDVFVDAVGLDFSDPQPLTVKQFAPVSAETPERNYTWNLSFIDSNYVVLLPRGDMIFVDFTYESSEAGMVRDFVLIVVGRYEKPVSSSSSDSVQGAHGSIFEKGLSL